MSYRQDRAYYLDRETAARDMAVRTDDPLVKRVHNDFADAYAERAKSVDPARA